MLGLHTLHKGPSARLAISFRLRFKLTRSQLSLGSSSPSFPGEESFACFGRCHSRRLTSGLCGKVRRARGWLRGPQLQDLSGARVASEFSSVYTVRMKRTNLVLDAQLLEEATRVLGERTYSGAVNRALAELLRVRKIQSLPSFFGKGLWQGNLAEMREDQVPHRRSRARVRGSR